MRLRFASRALGQLAHIREHIARRRPETAELVRGRILATVDRLRELPRIGRQGRTVGTREVRVPGLPYVMVYRIDLGDEDELVILGIFHVAQER